MSAARVLPLGGTAFTVELGDRLDAETNARVRALDLALALAPFEGYVESVPTLRSLLVVYDGRAVRPVEAARELASRVADPASDEAPGGVLHELQTIYGGDHGPDLAELARERGLTERELVRLHSSRDYTAYMLGFQPGFAYLGLVADPLECARLKTPRVRVPAGSVGIAGRQTGVYPAVSPGGWRLVGRTAKRLFDPARERPALLAPGDRVRFVPVAELRESEPVRSAPPRAARPALLVREPGLQTSVQAAPRLGMRRFGVTGAGPLDALAQAQANEAVGNASGAAALECAVTGPELEFLATVRFAIAGADLGAVLERGDLGPWPVPLGKAVLARPGNVLRFAGRRSGCRAYVALAGGIDVPEVLGSRSTDIGAGFGGFDGRALRTGDELGLASAVAAGAGRDSAATPYADSVTVRVVLGPQADHFAAETIERFLGEPFHVAATSDRVGCRLEGEPLAHAGPAEILSDGMVPGSVQVPPDGRPIVMLGDAPTTGGYPKIATVLAADLPRLAQLVPGEGRVRFEAVPLEDL